MSTGSVHHRLDSDRPAPRVLTQPADRPPSTNPQRDQALSVLWIDDEVRADDPLLELLTIEGVRTDVADSGAAGLAMAARNRYDASVLD
jgi:PleD family two-component response regulator